MEPTLTQEIKRVEPTNSNECDKQRGENRQPPVQKEQQKQRSNADIGACSSKADTTGLVLECVQYGETLTPKSNSKQDEEDLHPLVLLSHEAGESEISRNKNSECERPFKCEMCEILFKRKVEVEQHVQRIHFKVRPFKCEVCQKAFFESSKLNCHIRIHTKEQPYQCEFCLKTFNHRGSLNSHRRVHTGEKPYECEICAKAFRYHPALSAHRLVHTGEKPYECDICHKTFSLAINLKIHERVHTQERPYECKICSKKFKFTSNLRAHKQVHIKNRPY